MPTDPTPTGPQEDTLRGEIEKEVLSAIYCGDEDDTDVSGAIDRLLALVHRERRAAYGEGPFYGGFDSHDARLRFTASSCWVFAMHQIVELYRSGGPEAAIRTAFDLLPPKA